MEKENGDDKLFYKAALQLGVVVIIVSSKIITAKSVINGAR